MLNFITLLTGASVSAGFNLYLTILAIGLYARFGPASEQLMGMIEPFGSLWVLIPAGVLFVCEFIADKVPAFDNVWDVAHTIVRPLGAVCIALALAEDYGVAAQIFAATTGGSLAFSSHAIKAGARAIARLNPEPATNAASSTALSLAEDAIAIIVMLTALVAPWVAVTILAVMFVGMAWFGPRMISLFFFVTHATWSRFTAPFKKARREGPLQDVQPLFLSYAFGKAGEMTPVATSPCYSKLPGLVNYRRSAMVMTDDELMLVNRRFFMRRLRRVKLSDIKAVEHRQRWFREVLKVETEDGPTFYLFFVRGRSGYVTDLTDLLAMKGVTVTTLGRARKGAQPTSPALQPA